MLFGAPMFACSESLTLEPFRSGVASDSADHASGRPSIRMALAMR